MTEEFSATDSSARSEYLRNAILRQHLENVILRHPTSAAELASGLTYVDIVAILSSGHQDEYGIHGSEAEGQLPGGLSTTDLKRFGLAGPSLGSSLQRYLQEETENSLQNLALSCSIENNAEGDLEKALGLPNELLEQQARIKATSEHIASRRKGIEEIVQEINEVEPRLNSQLLQALESLPRLINTQRAAEFEELAMTLETCLLKLSLIRARTHTSLYQYSSPSCPNATMERALGALQDRLMQKRKQQEEEERQLDRMLNEYEQLLRMVDGEGGSFAQVVEDMARVRRETEECRRDLRRLGWTGE